MAGRHSNSSDTCNSVSYSSESLTKSQKTRAISKQITNKVRSFRRVDHLPDRRNTPLVFLLVEERFGKLLGYRAPGDADIHLAANLQGNHIVVNLVDTTYHTAAGYHFFAFFQAFDKQALLALALVLRANHEEVEYPENQ